MELVGDEVDLFLPIFLPFPCHPYLATDYLRNLGWQREVVGDEFLAFLARARHGDPEGFEGPPAQRVLIPFTPVGYKDWPRRPAHDSHL